MTSADAKIAWPHRYHHARANGGTIYATEPLTVKHLSGEYSNTWQGYKKHACCEKDLYLRGKPKHGGSATAPGVNCSEPP